MGAAAPPQPPRYVLDFLQILRTSWGGLPPPPNPVGHAGDVENDAGDVDELVKCVNFARKCCKIRHFAGPDEKRKKKPNKKRKKKIPK